MSDLSQYVPFGKSAVCSMLQEHWTLLSQNLNAWSSRFASKFVASHFDLESWSDDAQISLTLEKVVFSLSFPWECGYRRPTKTRSTGAVKDMCLRK